ncbi:DUF6056 family protein [Staphylococcus saccharolyticus]|uniref:DUF6056 family protein n=1 Tax=Staphylococcus saccharolyticus TaxID=33028 RepID=UPI001EE4C5EE|nr:DUF6056 family protein [Staphylococcus saccharolyticus]
MKQLRHHEYLLWYIGIFVYYSIMSVITPLSYVDWHVHLSQLMHHISQENGRYLGNLFEWLAMNSSILKILIYATLSCGIIYLCTPVVQVHKNVFYVIISFVALLCMPSSIYGETYGWFAGFYNYILSTIIALYIFYIVVRIVDDNKIFSDIYLWLFLLASLCGQFFLENISITNNLVILIGSILYFYFKRKLSYYLIMGLMLSLIGAIIMFLNPIYFKIKDGQSVYYSFSDSKGLIHKMGVTVLEQLPKYIFFNQYLILTIISLIIAGLLYRNERFRSQKIVIRVALITSLFTVPCYKVMVYDQFNFESYQKVLFIDILNVLVCFICFVSLIYFLIVIVN